MRWSYLGRQNFWIPTEKCETVKNLIKKNLASPFIEPTQFHPILA